MVDLIRVGVVQVVSSLFNRPKTVEVLRPMPVVSDEGSDAMLEPGKDTVCSD